MFKIIGGNGIEYGPVTADQIRQWIAEGRVSGQTLTQPEGTPGWKPISAFPEFAGAVGPAPQPPGGPPVSDETARARAASLLTGPFIGMLITGVAGFILFAFFCYFVQMVKSGYDFSKIPNMTPELLARFKEVGNNPNWPILVLGLAGSAFIIFAAFQMRAMKNHGLCVAACVIAILPYANACCCVGLPFGIWGLVVLLQPHVRACFK